MPKILHPKQVAAFQEWAKAMVLGATVERPKTKRAIKGGKRRRKPRKKHFRKRKRRTQD